MSDRSFQGYATVEQIDGQGMITVRADLADPKVAAAFKKATGLAVPETGKATEDGMRVLAWMSPDEAMVFCPAADAGTITADLKSALARLHALVVDVSDARAAFTVKGPAAREVLAKLAPFDTSAASFAVGDFRRTRIGQIAGAVYMANDTDIGLVCFRSVGDYAWGILCASATQGSEVFA